MSATYKVVAGDSLSKIAARNGVTLKELIAANPQFSNGRNPNLIKIGETIILPQPKLSPKKPAGEPCIPCDLAKEKEKENQKRREDLANNVKKDAIAKREDYAFAVRKEPLGKGTNKCSLYVHDKLVEAGFSLPPRSCGRLDFGTPDCVPLAEELYNGKLNDGTVLSNLTKVAEPAPGDIIAYKDPGSHWSGHAGIVTSFDPKTGTGTIVSAGGKDVHMNDFDLENGIHNSDGTFSPPVVFQRISK